MPNPVTDKQAGTALNQDGWMQGWLALAVSAMGLSALFAILLVASRTPWLVDWFSYHDRFHQALVLHVNFAVLIWLLSFISMLWLGVLESRNIWLDGASLLFTLLGAALILVSPMQDGAVPVMSNYIPVIDSTLFMSGLSLFALGPLLVALRLLGAAFGRVVARQSVSERLLVLSALAYVVALIGFALTALQMADHRTLDYETLFWGGGHQLQFVYSVALCALWLKWLKTDERMLGERIVVPVVVAVLVAGLLMSILLSVEHPDYRVYYTELMRYGQGLVIAPVLFTVLRRAGVLNRQAWLPIMLLIIGVVIGLLIHRDTVDVAAHYHAINGAITLSFMLWALGNEKYHWPGSREWLFTWQPRLYFMAMCLYVAGLAWSGWLGVGRKLSGDLQGLHGLSQQMGMGLMGSGGLLAIIASLMFVSIMAGVFRFNRICSQAAVNSKESLR